LPANATNKAVTWVSSTPSIATVTNGLVKAEKAGSAEITVTTQDGGFTAKCIVTVRNEDEQPFTSIAAFQAWLNKQPDNTIANAYEVKLNVSDLTGIGTVLKGALEKYIKLDLSGSTVTSIGERAFSLCFNLTSVIIPNSVTSIGHGAFQDCFSLTSVTFIGTIPTSEFSSANMVFLGDLRAKFYATDPAKGTPGTYTTSNPGTGAVWTKQ
jgi:hypothetical protein